MEDTANPRPTLLLIDDNITNLRVAVEHLKAHGFEILTARSGEAGIERARLAAPDLILLDVRMSGIDGFETCQRLKADPRTAAIPVIFTTALAAVEDKLRGFAVGGVDYIAKPFEIEEMLARITAHLTIYRLQRELQAEIRERKQAEAALRKANLHLQRLAVLDELTQIANRRRFHQYLQAQWSAPQRPALSLLLCDVDLFKRYNDHYGHLAGDQCLYLIAQGIDRVATRANDLVARYGGEEFAVILPDTDLSGALRVARALRDEVRRLSLPHAASDVSALVTLSIGAACVAPMPTTAPAVLVAAADAALYEAKRQGRDRTVVGQ